MSAFGQFNLYQPSSRKNDNKCSLNLSVGLLEEVKNSEAETATFKIKYNILNNCKSCYDTITQNVVDDNGLMLTTKSTILNTSNGPHIFDIIIDTSEIPVGDYTLKVIFSGNCNVKEIIKTIKFQVGGPLNIIYMSGDQLFNYQLFPKEILDTLPGYQKWKSRIQLDFHNHQITGSPCSPSRATMYTGLHPGTAKMSDNTGVTFQPALPAINNGGQDIYGNPLHTIGSLLNDYESRYVGKWHLDGSLNFRDFNKPMPTWNTRNVLQKYGLGIFNQGGDPCYYPHVAYWNDQMSTEVKLPPGTIGDYMDEDGNSFNGAIPFMRQKVREGGNTPWLLMINYEGCHDIMYYWANTDQELLVTALQANQLPRNINKFSSRQTVLGGETLDDISMIFNIRDFNTSSSIYNNDTTSPFPNGLLFAESFTKDFSGESLSNSITLDNYLIFSLGIDYLFTGMASDDIDLWKAYQQMYFNSTRQMDREMERIYDEVDRLGLWNKVAVIITADHGEMCGAHGLRNKLTTTYKQNMNVPLMIYSPNLKSPNTNNGEIQTITSHINVVPTILTIAGKTIPSNMEQSLVIVNSLGKLELNPSLNNEALFVCTSFMAYQGYFVARVLADPGQTTYPIPSPTTRILDRVTQTNSNLFSNNIFDYAGMVSAIVTEFEGHNYKFVRFYSLNAILIDTVQLLINNGMIQTIFDSGTFSPAQQALILSYPTTNVLPLNTKLDLLVEISLLANEFFKNPGIGKGFDTLVLPDAGGDINYQFQCFNLSTDIDEVINLADPTRVATNTILLNTLNARLDALIVEQRTDRMFISLPTERLSTFNIASTSMGSTVLNYWLTTVLPSDDTRTDVFGGYIGPFDDGEIIQVPKRRS